VRNRAIGFCRELADLYEVDLVIYDRKGAGPMKQGGLASPKNNRITMYVGGLNYHMIISIFFHELAHIECSRRGKYNSFHNGTPVQRARAMVFHGLQAERYVDRVGESMCREWLGETIKWKRAYSNSGEDLWFKINQVLPHYYYLKRTGQHRLDGHQDNKAAKVLARG
jgi:hypothetical protein